MKKLFSYIMLGIFVFLSCGLSVDADDTVDLTIAGSTQSNNVKLNQGAGGESQNSLNNDKLQDFDEGNKFIGVNMAGEEGLFNTLVRLAKDLKNLFYIIATIYFIIISIKLIFASNTEEEVGKFKKGILWITIGLIVMQLAYAFTDILFDKEVSAALGVDLVERIVYPLIKLLQTLAGIFFIAMAIFAFYRLVTANGNEEAIKSGKMTIFYALIGFVIIRFAKVIVEAFYGKLGDCTGSSIVSTEGSVCSTVNLSEGVQLIINIINWLNGFVAIAVLIMIIYAGTQIMLSSGDEEKIKKGKQSIIYIAIGLGVLVMNFLILTFFLRPESLI